MRSVMASIFSSVGMLIKLGLRFKMSRVFDTMELHGFGVCTGPTTHKLGVPSIQFQNYGADDAYAATCTTVQDGQRILGILYGACAKPSVDENRIFARWLQKKVVFSGASRWDQQTEFGPDIARLAMTPPHQSQTGQFTIFDSDGISVEFVSPSITVREGDIFGYLVNGVFFCACTPQESNFFSLSMFRCAVSHSTLLV